MRKIALLFTIIISLFTACKDENNNVDCMVCSQIEFSSQEKGQQILNELYGQIQSESLGIPCTDGTKWDTLPIGAKACGGPAGFIAYHTELHGSAFLKKVKEFTEAQKAFNLKWNMFSDCMAVGKPKRVDCVDGKPKMIP